MHPDPDRQTIDRELLDRYLAGESVADERASVDEWLAAHPDQAARLARSGGMTQEQVEAGWARVVTRIGGLTPESRTLRRERRQPGGRLVGQPLRRTAWSTLVGFLLGAAVIIAGWQLLRGIRMIGRPATSESVYTTYTTTNGQRATITLPDGNTVALNVASRLEVPTNYGVSNHMVRLPTGEALFTVSHHAGTPFTVISDAITARVLGTSFVVRHYRTDTATTIAVEGGKVAVGAAIITARRLVEIGRTGVLHVSTADSSRFSFATGVLTLESTGLASAIPELDRWYNADIQLGNATLASQRIKGNFTAGSLADLKAILEWTCNVRVVQDGRRLTLYPSER